MSDLGVDRVEAVDEAHFTPATVPVFDLDNVGTLVRGEVREEYGAASLEYIERAIELAQSGEFVGITTAPINKQATQMAGSTYAGHTGVLADRTDTADYAMMLVESNLRVTHVSTHVPLAEACEQVTTSTVQTTIRLTADALSDLGIKGPTVAVTGLNPHASDGGLLGATEADEIEPASGGRRNTGSTQSGLSPLIRCTCSRLKASLTALSRCSTIKATSRSRCWASASVKRFPGSM